MKKFSISIVAGLLTFGIGVAVAVVWMTRNTPKLGHPPAPSGQCVPLATQEYRFLTIGEDGYFPRGLLSRQPQLDKSMRSAFAKYLGQVNEPALMNSHASDNNSASDTNEVYRFTWLRSFHPKVVIRVWSDNGARMLTVKELVTENENRRAGMTVNHTRHLKQDEWAEFARLFDQACVWTLPSAPEVIANDGAWWVFEAASPGHYQIVNRQVPESSYRELCLYLLKLSGLPLDESNGEIY